MVADHRVPLRDDTGVFDILVMGGRAVVMSVVNAETPPTILPQGAVPFGVVRLLVATFEAIREGGAFAFVGLVFGDGACL